MAKKKVEQSVISKATINDFEVIIKPVITEKSMKLLQEQNKITLEVKQNANKIQILQAFENIFNVKTTGISITNVPTKTTTRGGRYQGTIGGYKKAIITLAEGETVDLYKE